MNFILKLVRLILFVILFVILCVFTLITVGLIVLLLLLSPIHSVLILIGLLIGYEFMRAIPKIVLNYQLRKSNSILRNKKGKKITIFLKYFIFISTIDFIKYSILFLLYKFLLDQFKLFGGIVSITNFVFLSFIVFCLSIKHLKIKTYNAYQLEEYIHYFKFIQLFFTIVALVSVFLYVLNFSYFEKTEMVHKVRGDSIDLVYIDGTHYTKSKKLDIFSSEDEKYVVYKKDDLIIVPEDKNGDLFPDELFSNSVEKSKEMYIDKLIDFKVWHPGVKLVVVTIIINTINIVMFNLSDLGFPLKNKKMNSF